MKSLSKYFDGFFDAVEGMEGKIELETAIRMMAEFYQYIDSLATANPHRFHHVYEWGGVGVESARLFELNATPTINGVVISYEFLDSVVPNENGQVFAKKASVMESGQTVEFYTDKPVPIGDGEFRVGGFRFKPGGDETTGSFGEAFMLYFSTRALPALNRNVSIHPSSMTWFGGKRDGEKLYDRIIGK